ncbi:hypothetical protein XENTR_v10005793 [Xenopus tropicalis]|nr:hypothetical protein XENTR_v10005793 [Xenopus tropicalis]
MLGNIRFPTAQEALPGRSDALQVADKHMVNGNSTLEPFPDGLEIAVFGLTAHAEVVRVVFDPKVITYKVLLKLFWENHDPTEGMKQGEDVGTQYRSVIFTYGENQKDAALLSREAFQKELNAHGLGITTTEIRAAPTFYYAEDYHQQYLHKNPEGFCGLRRTGATCH